MGVKWEDTPPLPTLVDELITVILIVDPNFKFTLFKIVFLDQI